MMETRPLDKMGLGTGLLCFVVYVAVLLWAIYAPIGPTEPPAEPAPVMTPRLDVGDKFIWTKTDAYVRPLMPLQHGAVITEGCRPEPGAKIRVVRRSGDRLLCEVLTAPNRINQCGFGTRFWMTVDGVIEP